MDKYKKANLAILYGVDLVIELPEIYAISSASYFAYYAICILESLKIVDYVCFGSECGNIETLKNISNKILNNEENFWKNLKEQEKNVSFAKSRENVLSNFLTSEELQIIKNSNDILGIEYIGALKKLNSKIEPVCIKRNNSFISATQIRNEILNNSIKNVQNYVPNETYELLNNNYVLNKDIFKILRYKILTTKKEELANIKDIGEGLENKILKEIVLSSSYDDFISKLKSKRYQMTRIKRILINILLGITKIDFDQGINNNILYAHILGISKNGKKLLPLIANSSNIPIITSPCKATITNEIKMALNYDILAENIYSILNNENINKDYTNKL